MVTGPQRSCLRYLIPGEEGLYLWIAALAEDQIGDCSWHPGRWCCWITSIPSVDCQEVNCGTSWGAIAQSDCSEMVRFSLWGLLLAARHPWPSHYCHRWFLAIGSTPCCSMTCQDRHLHPARAPRGSRWGSSFLAPCTSWCERQRRAVGRRQG